VWATDLPEDFNTFTIAMFDRMGGHKATLLRPTRAIRLFMKSSVANGFLVGLDQ